MAHRPAAAKPAVILDRDGTLIEDRGDLGSADQVVFYPETLPALRQLARRFVLVIVTHQPAVGRGKLSLTEVAAVNEHVVAELARAGIPIAGVYTCPHERADRCHCIKPEPALAEQAAREHGLDLSRSYVIGDHPHDVELARRVGALGVYVLSGHGLKHRGELGPGHVVVPGIGAAARAVMEDSTTDPEDPIDTAARAIRRGGLAAFPTETVYGLGASALDPAAVVRVFEVKRRPSFDPLIVHLEDSGAVDELAMDLSDHAHRLMQRFWPGPLTLVLKRRDLVPDIVTAGLSTVALRVPDHPVALRLLKRAAVPICAPSANPFGYVSPTTAAHVFEQLGDQVDQVLDGGACRVGLESTIVSLASAEPVLLRPGGTPVEAIEAALGVRISSGQMGGVASAPGMLPRHYSPHLRLVTFAGQVPPPPPGRTGLLLISPRSVPEGYVVVETLSHDGELGEVARNLFAAIRRLDRAPLDCALVELAPESGIGAAINDRLKRAAARGEYAERR